MAAPTDDFRTALSPDLAGGYRRWAVVAAALLGLAYSLYLQFAPYVPKGTHPKLPPTWGSRVLGSAVLLATAALSAIGPVRRRVGAGLDRLRHPSPGRRRLLTVAIMLLAALYCWYEALAQGRDLGLLTQDERMYLLQTHQVAAGHLYEPAHPKADFFQTFYVFVRPVYAAMYFPGAAIMMAPIAWLHLSPWAWMVLIAGGVIGMTFRVVSELSDAVYGTLAALAVLMLSNFRTLSIMAKSYLPMSLLILLIAWAFLHWRRERRLGWAAVLGALLGWAAITRPLDAVCFGASFGVAMLWELRDSGLRRIALGLGVTAACAAPFLSLQLIANRGITGYWFRTPVSQYHQTFFPGVEIGGLEMRVRAGAHPFPPGTPPQFVASYKQFLLPAIERNQKSRTPVRRYEQTVDTALAHPVLIGLFFVGLVGLTTVGRVALAGGALVFPMAYLFFLYTRDYPTVIAPVLAAVAVLGVEQLVLAFPRAKAFVGTWLTLAVLVLVIGVSPAAERAAAQVMGGGIKPLTDFTIRSPIMQAYNQAERSIEGRAVVFFKYAKRPKGLWRHEQTHNCETARIDDARVVHARDLGRRNLELIKYYGRNQPDRTVYVFDPRTKRLTRYARPADLTAEQRQAIVGL